MIKSCVTISLVSQARGGPFVFWDDLADCCLQAEQLGFDAIEIFPPSAEALSADSLRHLLTRHGLSLAAVGTGAGWVIERLSLTADDAGQREAARSFVRSIIDLAGLFGASAIIGSMQGRWDDRVDKDTAVSYLTEALNDLGAHARQYDVPLFYEPLNRYETNLVNRVDDGVALLESLSTDNVKLLADLFHMNIEEANLPASLRAAGDLIGHLHFVDSNRRPAGFGHMDYEPIAAALKEIGYCGYASAEALPYPDSGGAAQMTIETFRKYLAPH